ASVAIIPDNDEAGRDHARAVAASLRGSAASVKIVELPRLPPKGDVSDWINAGGTAEALHTLIASVEAERRAEGNDAAAAPWIWIDMSRWDEASPPAREWAIKDRVPLRQVGLMSGEGGAGKSILEMTKDVAHVAAKHWLGSMPEQGPAFYIGCEDEEDEN